MKHTPEANPEAHPNHMPQTKSSGAVFPDTRCLMLYVGTPIVMQPHQGQSRQAHSCCCCMPLDVMHESLFLPPALLPSFPPSLPRSLSLSPSSSLVSLFRCMFIHFCSFIQVVPGQAACGRLRNFDCRSNLKRTRLHCQAPQAKGEPFAPHSASFGKN